MSERDVMQVVERMHARLSASGPGAACVGCTERVEAAVGEPVVPCPHDLSASGRGERSCETCSAPNGAECTRRGCSGTPAFDRWEPVRASGQGEERWISMADRWPEPKQSVLVVLSDNDGYYSGSMRVCRFCPFDYGDGKLVPEFSMPGFGGLTATHWMPLPAAPAPDKGEAAMPSLLPLLRDVEEALADLGACDNPYCTNCSRVLPRIRAAIREHAAGTEPAGRIR